MTKDRRVKCPSIYFSQAEYEIFRAAKSKSTCRSISEYGRKLLLGAPVTIYYRNKSMDDLIETYLLAKDELAVIMNSGGFTAGDLVLLFKEIKNLETLTLKLFDHVSQDRTR